MDYTIDELSSASTIGRISIGAKSYTSDETSSSTNTTVQKQIKTKVTQIKTEEKRSLSKDLYQRVHSLVGGSSAPENISRSASSSQLAGAPIKPETPETSEWSRKVTTSISNIGGAVMRSKTADIERMLKISKPDSKKLKPKTDVKVVEKEKSSKLVSEEEKKKYAKRRYTDSRHQTKTLVDSVDQANSQTKTQSIWKRRELISSPLNEDGSSKQ